MQTVPERHLNSRQSSFDEFSRRYQALLHTGDVAVRYALPQSLQELSKHLRELVEFNFLNYALHDPASDTMRVFTISEEVPAQHNSLQFSVDGSPAGWVWSHQQPLVIHDLQVEHRFPTALEAYRSRGFRSLITLPMTTDRRQLGALGFGSVQATHCDGEVLQFLERITGLVGLAVENSLIREAMAAEEEQLRNLAAVTIQLSERGSRAYERLRAEREKLETVLEINAALAASKLDVTQMFPAISKSLNRAIPHDAAVINLWDESSGSFRVLSQGSPDSSEFAPQGTILPSDKAFTTQVLKNHEQGAIVRRAELQAAAFHFQVVRKALEAGMVCWCAVPIRTSARLVGVLYLGSRRDDAYHKPGPRIASPSHARIGSLHRERPHPSGAAAGEGRP